MEINDKQHNGEYFFKGKSNHYLDDASLERHALDFGDPLHSRKSNIYKAWNNMFEGCSRRVTVIAEDGIEDPAAHIDLDDNSVLVRVHWEKYSIFRTWALHTNPIQETFDGSKPLKVVLKKDGPPFLYSPGTAQIIPA